MARHERPSARRGDPGHATVTWARFGVVWAWVWVGLTLAILFVAVAQWTGLDPVRDNDAALGAVMTSFMTAAVGMAGALGSRTRSVAPAPPTPSPIPPPSSRPEKRSRFPRVKSGARQPMLDLAEAEDALAELLRQLSAMPDGPMAPEDVIEQAWQTATETATRLRSVAARLEAVELAARYAPPGERAALQDGAGSLRLHLDQGIEAYRTLIAAAGRVVLAGTPVVATTELVDASESLASLAEALHELSTPDQNE